MQLAFESVTIFKIQVILLLYGMLKIDIIGNLFNKIVRSDLRRAVSDLGVKMNVL